MAAISLDPVEQNFGDRWARLESGVPTLDYLT
jgi:hypothetical protein